MKKLILFLVIHLSAMAQPVYCPAEIFCDQSNQLASCAFEQHPKKYWDKITGHQNLAGVYHNTYVSAPFYSYDQGYALCIYTHENSYKTLTLHAKPESNLEMLIQDHEPWRFEEAWWECEPVHATSCPLQEQAALFIKNNTTEPLYLFDQFTILPDKFIRLYPDDFPQPWVDIYTQSNFVGRIMVNVKNRVQMTHVVEGNPDLYELIGMDGFNALEVHDIIIQDF